MGPSFFRYRLHGQREKLTLGKYPALTLKNARLKRDEAAQLVAMGQSPAQKKQHDKIAGPEHTTVAEFAERFFKDIQERDRKDSTMPRRYLEKDILPHIGEKPIKAITAEDVRSVIWKKKKQGFDAAAGQVRRLVDEQHKRESAAVAEGSAGDDVGSSLAGRRAKWNLARLASVRPCSG